MPSNHLIFCHPLLLLPSIFPSIRGFLNESDLPIRWPKCWTFSFSISPSKEYSGLISFRIDSGLISFRIDWLDLLAVQGTLKSLLQHHSSKASVLWLLAFFIAQLSHPCMTTGNTIDLTIQTFVSKVMSLCFNVLSMFIAFLPRSKHILISWLQSPCVVYCIYICLFIIIILMRENVDQTWRKSFKKCTNRKAISFLGNSGNSLHRNQAENTTAFISGFIGSSYF